MADLSLRVLITAQDAASSVIRGIASNFGPIGVGMAAIGTAAVAAGASAVKMAGDYQSSLTSLVTGAGEAQSNIKLVSDGILNLSTVTGTSTKQLTDGMYMIESAGYHGAAGLDVLKASAEGAKVGNADLASVANGVTTAMTDYASKGLTASQATNTLVATVAAGKTRMSDLATAMSTILPTSAAVGVSFTGTSAAMATMTGEGTNAASAATYLRQMLMALESPAKKGADALKSIGLSTQQVATDMKTSLPGTLQEITDALAKKFPVGSAAYMSALKDISGGSKQMQGMLELTGDHLKVFQSNMTGITDAVNQGGTAITGWSQVQGTFNVQMDRMKASMDAALITLGTALLPVITQIIGAVADAVGAFSNWVTQSGALQAVAGLLSAAMTNVGQVIQMVVQAVQGSFADLPDEAGVWGQNLVTGFANGISSGTGVVGQAINAIIDEVSAMIGFMSPTRKGPGRHMDKWGPNLVKGFADGITSNVSQVSDAVTQLTQPLLTIPNVNLMQNGGVSLDDKFSIAKAATAGAGIAKGASSAISSNSPALASASQAVNNHLESMCSTAHSVSSCVSTSSAKTTAAAAKQAAAQQKQQEKAAAAAAKHAASVKKHQDAVAASTAKHQVAQAASAAKHAAALKKHQEVVQAQQVKHQQVLAREAAKHAAALKKQHASGGKSSGGGSALGGISALGGGGLGISKLPTIAHSAGVQTAAGVASGLSSGTGQVVSAVQKMTGQMGTAFSNGLQAVSSIFKNLIQIIGPIISIAIQIFAGLWKTLLVVGQAVGNMLLPALSNLSAAITPIIVGILTWIATSGIIPIIFNIIQIAVTVVIAVLSLLINAIASVISFFTQTEVGAALLKGVLVALGAILLFIAVASLPAIISAIGTMLVAFGAWIVEAVLVGIANIAAFWPIILIILAIVVVVALVILIFTHWGEIAHWLQGVWAAVVNWFKSAWGATGAWFQGLWSTVSKAVAGFFGGVGAFFVGLWNGIKNGATTAWNGLVNGIKGIVNGVVTWLKGIWQDAVNTVVGWFNWLYNHNYYFKDLVDEIIKQFTITKNFIIQVWNDIVAFFTGIWNRIVTNTEQGWKNISSTLTTWNNNINKFVQGIWNDVVTFITGIWNKIVTNTQTGWKNISNVVSGAWNNYIAGPLGALWNNVATWAVGIWNQVWKNTQQGWQNISNVVRGAWNTYIAGPLGSLWNQLSNWFGNLANQALQWGRNLIQSLINGINGMLGNIGQAAQNVAKTIASFLGFHSPAKEGPGSELMTWGPGLVKGFSESMLAAKPILQSSLNLLMAPVAQTLSSAPPTSASLAGGGGSTQIGEIHVHLNSNTNDAKQQGQQVAQEVQKQLAKLVRGQAITPRLTSGGRH